MIGMSLHGEEYVTSNIEEMSDYDEETGIVYGGNYGWEMGIERDTGVGWSELDIAYDDFAEEMSNAPPLQDNVMLFTTDIPNLLLIFLILIYKRAMCLN